MLLKNLKDSIATPLFLIFNLSLSEGIFPDAMKLADVVLLLKGGNKCFLNNYRPISLLPTISKLLEKIVYSRTYEFLTKHEALFQSQYGLRKKHSCEHAITELVGEICKGYENKCHTIAIFIDLSKAFDTISHEILIQKLEHYGIRGIYLKWFQSYLQNQALHVRCETTSSGYIEYSDPVNLTIGTPQGSCLGPLLFLVFCNDIYLNLELCKGILFVDDTTIYNSHKNMNYLKWSICHDLVLLSDWFKANHLSMNCSKTIGMLFSMNKNLKIDYLQAEDITVNFVPCTKFLGLWINNKLDWKEHLSHINLKIRRNLYMLKCGKNLLSVHSKRILYYAQIQSHLGYGLSIWGNMSTATDLSNLQKLQNKGVALINNTPADLRTYKKLNILRIKE